MELVVSLDFENGHGCGQQLDVNLCMRPHDDGAERQDLTFSQVAALLRLKGWA